jgi:hypothetical protein
VSGRPRAWGVLPIPFQAEIGYEKAMSNNGRSQRQTKLDSAFNTQPNDVIPARPTPQEVAARAYSLYEAEGRPNGHAEDHWLRAECEVMQERQASVRS